MTNKKARRGDAKPGDSDNSVALRNALHQFAITYRPETKESRRKCIDAILTVIREGLERELPELTLQDAINAKMFPTPEEYKKMIWVLKWYEAELVEGPHT